MAMTKRLMIEGVSAEALARRFGTPLYAYSKAALLDRFGRLRKAFRARPTLICYALKANSNRAVCRLFARAGAGADIVSGGELERALAAGFPSGRIVFSGVGKTVQELELALRRGVLTLNVESPEELAALAAVARRLKRPAPVSIRLNPDIDPKTHPHITTGRAENKFGVERGEALRLFRRAAADRWLRVKGIQCHLGSQITDTRPYALAAKTVTGLISQLAKEGISVELADFGGGLGVAYQGDREHPVEKLAATLAAALRPWPRVRLLMEPGRYLVADAGLLLTRVLYRKSTSRRRFLIVDAAMNDLGRPALYGAWHPIVPARPRRGTPATVDVVGPICESGDFLGRARRLPPCEAGDVLAVLKAGAYGFSMSSQYNSRPRAAEVLVNGTKARLVRRRESLADLVSHEL
ncbi:MAG: diaminopimelate decarboxylase [Elusimicrobia bacterium]|nr:diaminopimelate decarboxylase [Elusimicrobiota bacterium]